MKSYPTKIALTVPAANGKMLLRWFDVHSPRHEAQVRAGVKAQLTQIAAAREIYQKAVAEEEKQWQSIAG